MWALALLYGLTERWQGTSTARRVVVFAVLYRPPFSYFTAYSESLFLLLSLLVFQSLERERWVWAGLFVFLAILTRLQGVALARATRILCMDAVAGRKKIIGRTCVDARGAAHRRAFCIWRLRALAGETNVLPTSEPQLNARLAPPWENVIYAVQVVASGHFSTADVLNLAATLLAGFILVARLAHSPAELCSLHGNDACGGDAPLCRHPAAKQYDAVSVDIISTRHAVGILEQKSLGGARGGVCVCAAEFVFVRSIFALGMGCIGG